MLQFEIFDFTLAEIVAYFQNDIVVAVVWAANPDAVIVAGLLILIGFALSMRLLSKFPIALLLSLG
ncbi:MAG: hypothetical protein ACW960_13690, partial [Candidatus Thorarchaeota archaeon]